MMCCTLSRREGNDGRALQSRAIANMFAWNEPGSLNWDAYKNPWMPQACQDVRSQLCIVLTLDGARELPHTLSPTTAIQ